MRSSFHAFVDYDVDNGGQNMSVMPARGSKLTHRLHEWRELPESDQVGGEYVNLTSQLLLEAAVA